MNLNVLQCLLNTIYLNINIVIHIHAAIYVIKFSFSLMLRKYSHIKAIELRSRRSLISAHGWQLSCGAGNCYWAWSERLNFPIFNHVVFFKIRVNLEVRVFCNQTVTLQCNGSTSLPSAAISDPSATFLWWTITRRTCIAVYTVITITMVVTVFVRCLLFVRFFTNISTNLYNDMFNAVIRATMLFFNTNSSGNSNSIGYHTNATLF